MFVAALRALDQLLIDLAIAHRYGPWTLLSYSNGAVIPAGQKAQYNCPPAASGERNGERRYCIDRAVQI
jgi:hypothetical protein